MAYNLRMVAPGNADRVYTPAGDDAALIELIDGGDRACGELLLVLAARARALPPGTQLRLLATDPAAPLDLPAWCHLTGHRYLGHGRSGDGRPHYDVETVQKSNETEPNQPWLLRPSSTNREDTHP